ncbi:hypothetical protein JCM3765_004728 [Sporobolomyces pararoseus]
MFPILCSSDREEHELCCPTKWPTKWIYEAIKMLYVRIDTLTKRRYVAILNWNNEQSKISSQETSSILRVILPAQSQAGLTRLHPPSNTTRGLPVHLRHFQPNDPPLKPRPKHQLFEQLPAGQHAELPNFNTIQLPPHPHENPLLQSQAVIRGDLFYEDVFNFNDPTSQLPSQSNQSIHRDYSIPSVCDPRLFNPHHLHDLSLSKHQTSSFPNLTLRQKLTLFGSLSFLTLIFHIHV